MIEWVLMIVAWVVGFVALALLCERWSILPVLILLAILGVIS